MRPRSTAQAQAAEEDRHPGAAEEASPAEDPAEADVEHDACRPLWRPLTGYSSSHNGIKFVLYSYKKCYFCN